MSAIPIAEDFGAIARRLQQIQATGLVRIVWRNMRSGVTGQTKPMSRAEADEWMSQLEKGATDLHFEHRIEAAVA